MVERIKAKNSLDCDVKVLSRRKNTPNTELYEELKMAILRSYAGVGIWNGSYMFILSIVKLVDPMQLFVYNPA